MNKLPYQVGITGGIGSGKSIICQVFSQTLNIPIYEADARAKWLMVHDEDLKTALSLTFGMNTYHDDGTLNRRYLAEKVFGSTDEVKKLNALVHPKVREDALEWAIKQDAPYILREIPLLFETGAQKALNATITVSAPVPLRIQRIKSRDPQRSEQEIQGIMAKQATEEQRNSQADYILYNDETRLLLPQIVDLHQKLLVQAQNFLSSE